MTQQYQTRDGDMVDEIAWNYYGTRGGLAVEKFLEANPGLADQPARLPAGLLLVLPDLATPATTTKSVKLWD